MEKAMAPHSSTLVWKIPWTEEPGGLQSMGSLRAQHDWVTITLPGVDFSTLLTATFPLDFPMSSAWFPLWPSLLSFLKHLCSSVVCLSAAAAAAKLLQSCPTVWPRRWLPTRLLCPWYSSGKNTGVGCHFLLQCMKVKSESEVAQLCPTLGDPMDCSLPGSSIHGIFQARVLDWGAIAFSGGLSRLSYCFTSYIFLGSISST